jgi:hypothetical protein
MTSTLAAFLGSLLGQAVGGVLMWRYYIRPRMARAANRRTAPPPSSQPAPTTATFTPHDRPVMVQKAQWGRMKKAPRL